MYRLRHIYIYIYIYIYLWYEQSMSCSMPCFLCSSLMHSCIFWGVLWCRQRGVSWCLGEVSMQSFGATWWTCWISESWRNRTSLWMSHHLGLILFLEQIQAKQTSLCHVRGWTLWEQFQIKFLHADIEGWSNVTSEIKRLELGEDLITSISYRTEFAFARYRLHDCIYF